MAKDQVCVCRVIPSARIREIAPSVLPNRRYAGVRRGEPAATGPEVLHPRFLRTPQRGGGYRSFLVWSSSVTLPQIGRVWGGSRREQRDIGTKRGCEKFILCPISSSSKLFAPSISACILPYDCPKKLILSSVQRRTIKIKAADRHSSPCRPPKRRQQPRSIALA